MLIQMKTVGQDPLYTLSRRPQRQPENRRLALKGKPVQEDKQMKWLMLIDTLIWKWGLLAFALCCFIALMYLYAIQ